MNALWTLAGLVLGLEVVVLFHMLGHFLVARILRVPSELHLGFGPALPGCRFSRGSDTYIVAWFPLGGYIKVPMPATPDG
jgi:regulator of sigma E protease